jgi:hypothetical protein
VRNNKEGGEKRDSGDGCVEKGARVHVLLTPRFSYATFFLRHYFSKATFCLQRGKSNDSLKRKNKHVLTIG